MMFISREFHSERFLHSEFSSERFVKDQPKYSKRNPQIIVLNTYCVVGGPGDIAMNQTDTILVPPWDFYSRRKKQKQNQIYAKWY